ncbi:MAG: hypothetical protein AAGC84_14500, partial [Pseudomonas sp.]
EPVRSIRFAALLSNAVPASVATADSAAWRFWHGKLQPSAAQGRFYQVISGTTALRNLLP